MRLFLAASCTGMILVCLQVFAEGPQGGFFCGKHIGSGRILYIQYQLEQETGKDPQLSVTSRCAVSDVNQAFHALWQKEVGHYIAEL
jgi:hypothetical protein